MREVGDRVGEATTLTNIGAVYNGLGDLTQALAYLEQAFPSGAKSVKRPTGATSP